MREATATVAAGHPLICRTALEIMANGGNAYDAAAAAGFTSAVAELALTSLGGGGFLLARTAEQQTILFDFFSDTPGLGLAGNQLEPHFFPVTLHFPGSDQDFNVGMGSVAVPGNLKGFLHVHHKMGRLPLKEILKPAIQCAGKGIPVSRHQASFLELIRPIMTMTEPGRSLHRSGDRYLRHGDTFFNADLADFLEKLSKDQDAGFYEGELAARIDSDMRAGQGLLTAEDLQTYKVIERSPLTASYRGRSFLTNPPPSLGGSLVALTLRLLGKKDIAALPWGEADHALFLARTLIKVDQLRAAGMSIAQTKSFQRGTTHVSIVDHEGNVAAMTTSNGEGSGYIVPGTGIMLNNMMGEDDLHPEGFHACPPGQRVGSMMSPSVVINGQGKIELVLGSGGSKRIRTALVQVLSNIFDFGMEVQEAVEAPRLHWDGEVIQIEPGWPEASLEALRSLAPVNVWTDKNVYFGGVHAVMPGRGGAGDSRRGGASLDSSGK